MFSSIANITASLALLTAPLPFLVSAQNCSASPPIVQPQLFSAVVNLAGALPPIPTTGGVRLVEPIISGNVTGPAFNAVVLGGLAYPSVIKNGSVEDAEIFIFGNTTDKVPVPYFATISGIGDLQGQVARLTIEIGGKYSNLAAKYILASINPAPDRVTVAVQAYEVSQC